MTNEEKKKDVKKITTPKFRGSFVFVLKPKANLQDKLVYSIAMLFDKKDVKAGALKDLQRIVKEAAIERWGEIPKDLVLPFKDGDLKNYEGYKGCIFVNATSQNPPVVLDGQLQTILDPNEVYSGAYYKASVTAFAWPKEGAPNLGKRGVSIGLQNLQKDSDGEALSGRGNAEDDFEPIMPEAIDVIDTEELLGSGSGSGRVGGDVVETKPKDENFGIEGL